jgi:hypothetical protein
VVNRIVRIGELEVPTGRLVVCDPIAIPDEPPLARAVPTGTYSVEVSLVEIAPQHSRVASMRVSIADRPATSTEHAADFGVDAGLVAIMDARTQAERATREAALLKASPLANYYDDVLAEELEDPEREWTMHRPLPDGGNVAIVQSGLGRLYSCFWLLDAGAEPVALIVDFKLGDDEDADV